MKMSAPETALSENEQAKAPRKSLEQIEDCAIALGR
jgi:hypothetical protein